jgi:protein-S-isoprenylcysteine O-methyltransferase Ste14
MKLVSKLALLIVVAAIAYLLFSGNLLARSPFVIAAQVSAVALSVWARRSFQTAQFSIHAEPRVGALLVKGPYRLIRHPMYAAALAIVWSGILAHISTVNLIIGGGVTAVTAVRIVIEEAGLRERYPGYPAYARATKRLIPLLI